MHIATLSSTGSLELPLEVQESLQLHPGSRLAIETEEGKLILHVVKDLSAEREALRDIFAAGPSLSEALLKMKDEEAALEAQKWTS